MTTLGGTAATNVCNPAPLGGTVGQSPTAGTGTGYPVKKPKPALQQVPRVGAGQSFVIKAHRHSDLDHVSSDEEEDEKVAALSFLFAHTSGL
jgi:hypothetical protein